MKILIYLGIAVILFVMYVRHLERNALFFPEKVLLETPEEVGLVYEDVYLQLDNGLKIHGWHIPSKADNATVLYLHGNAGNISDRVGKIRLLHDLGVNVFIIDYQGYGQSEGKPTEAGINTDAIAAYQFLVNERNIKPERIVVYGASLGAVPATYLASKKEVGALIMDSAFSSAVDMASIIYPFVPSFLITIKLDNIKYIKNVDAPKLFVHSSEDEVVPFHLGEKFFRASPQPKQFLTLKGSHVNGHLEDEELFKEGLIAFLEAGEFI